MKVITVALTAVLVVGTVHAMEPAKWQDPGIVRVQQDAPVKKGKLLLAKKKDHSKDEAKGKPAKKSKK